MNMKNLINLNNYNLNFSITTKTDLASVIKQMKSDVIKYHRVLENQKYLNKNIPKDWLKGGNENNIFVIDNFIALHMMDCEIITFNILISRYEEILHSELLR